MQTISVARTLATRAQEEPPVDTAAAVVAALAQHGFMLRPPLPSRDTSDVVEVAREPKAAKASGRPVDPEGEARRERSRTLRAIAEQAHGASLDLGWALMTTWPSSTRRQT